MNLIINKLSAFYFSLKWWLLHTWTVLVFLPSSYFEDTLVLKWSPNRIFRHHPVSQITLARVCVLPPIPVFIWAWFYFKVNNKKNSMAAVHGISKAKQHKTEDAVWMTRKRASMLWAIYHSDQLIRYKPLWVFTINNSSSRLWWIFGKKSSYLSSLQVSQQFIDFKVLHKPKALFFIKFTGVNMVMNNLTVLILSAKTRRIAIKFGSDVHDGQMMNSSHSDNLTLLF